MSSGRFCAALLALLLAFPAPAMADSSVSTPPAAPGASEAPRASAPEAAGEVVIHELQLEQPAPAAGFLFDEVAVRRLIEDLRDLRAAQAVVETQKAALAARERELGELRDALAQMNQAYRQQEIALAKAEERERIRAEIDAKAAAMFQRLEKLIERQDAALARAEKRIDELNNRSAWKTFLSGLGGLFAGILTGGIAGGLR